MSKAVIPIATVALEDPVTRLGRPTAWGVPQGGIVYTYQQVAATTFQGTNINFVAPPPSPEIIVDRRVMIQAQFNLTFTCTPAFGMPVLQLGSNDGPRAFPLMQAMNTMAATINNNTISALMDPVPALMRYNFPFSLAQQDYSASPCMLDQYQEYDFYNGIPQAAQPPFPFAFNQQGGTERNPLGSYGNNIITPSRGGFLMQIIANPVGDGVTPQTAAVLLIVTEPIFMTPFAQWGEEPGFYGIQTLNINFTLNQNWWLRTWSSNYNRAGAQNIFANNGTISNPAAGVANLPAAVFTNAQITGLISTPPQLLFRYITPSPIKTLPPLMEYPYSSVQVFTSQNGTVGVPSVFANQNAQTSVSNSIQFNTIPDQIFIFLYRQAGDRNHLTSDTFGAIYPAVGGISINFMNQTGLLASATPYDLYCICKRNGFVGTFDQWRNEVGSVICIKPGLDLGLEPSLAPGMNGLYNFQVTVKFYNPSANPTNYTLYIVPITSGLVTIKDNGTVTQTGILTRADVLAAQQAPAMGYQEAVKLVGGDFFGNLKNILSRAANAAPAFFSRFGRVAQASAPLLEEFGANRYAANARNYGARSGRIGNLLGDINQAAYGSGMYGAGFNGQHAQPGAAADPEYMLDQVAPAYALDPSMEQQYPTQDSYESNDQQIQQGMRRRREEENYDAGPPERVSRMRMSREEVPMDPRDSMPQFR